MCISLNELHCDFWTWSSNKRQAAACSTVFLRYSKTLRLMMHVMQFSDHKMVPFLHFKKIIIIICWQTVLSLCTSVNAFHVYLWTSGKFTHWQPNDRLDLQTAWNKFWQTFAPTTACPQGHYHAGTEQNICKGSPVSTQISSWLKESSIAPTGMTYVEGTSSALLTQSP